MVFILNYSINGVVIYFYTKRGSIFFIIIYKLSKTHKNKLVTLKRVFQGGAFLRNKDYLKKIYKQFSIFIETATARELEYFVLDAKYTSTFNKRVKELVEEVEKESKKDVNISVIFDTNGEIALIAADVLGKYIGDCYNLTMGNYYKEESLNRVVREVINGSEKAQVDFVRVSYAVMYNVLGGLYSEIKCRKEVMDGYKESYGLVSYEKQDLVLIVLSLLIIEDICRYIGIKPEAFLKCIQHIKHKKDITN